LIYKFIIILAVALSFKTSLSQDSLQFVNSFGKFQNAVSVSTAREEFIFVSDIESNKIYKLSSEGKELASFGGSGLGQNELNQPYSIDATNGLDVLVADNQNNRIKRLDINLNYITSFDFNAYNLTAESSQRIYNPKSIASLSTGEVFVLCDANNYYISKINDFTEIKLIFGSNSLGQDRLDNPRKIVTGSQLDVWVLDKTTNEILNFNNFGSFVKKITPQDTKEQNAIISISHYSNNLYILSHQALIIYDLKLGQFTGYFLYNPIKYLADITIFDKSTVLLLSAKAVHKLKIK
jgi:hypothetical protein